jgi:hypothetical protein
MASGSCPDQLIEHVDAAHSLVEHPLDLLDLTDDTAEPDERVGTGVHGGDRTPRTVEHSS